MIKKILLGISIALTVAQAETYAQADKKALIEVFTNSHCSICPSMYNGINTYVKSNEINNDVVYIFYHINTYNDDPLYQETKTESLPRGKYYNVTGTPSAALNGTIQDRTYSEYPTRISNAIQQSQDINISVDGMLKNDGVSLTITTDTEIPSNASLYLVVTEDITYKGRNGITEHTNVMRKMLTGINGAVPEIKSGAIFSGNFSLEQLNTRSMYNAAIVCFLQNNTTKEIYQVTRKSISSFITSSSHEDINPTITVFPNPTSYGCTVTIPDTGIQTLTVYSLLGEKVKTITSTQNSNSGGIQFFWNGNDEYENVVPKGLYFIKDEQGEYSFPVVIK